MDMKGSIRKWSALIAAILLYFVVLYSFLGGGDMNGIALVFPELAVRIVFGVIAAVNLFIIFKYLLPLYRKEYQA